MSDQFDSDFGSAELSDLKATVVLPSSGEMPSAGERSDLIDQAYDEFCERVQAGEVVDPDEFCARFPGIQTSVRKLVHCHRELEALPDRLGEISIRWPASGEEFLGYRLVSELGRGAFARVFLAHEVSIGGRLVAVKLSMHDDHEADTLGRVEHTNVVPIYSTQYDVATGLSMVVMPFLGGTTLCHVIDQLSGPKRPQLATALLKAASDARWQPERAAPPVTALSRGNYVEGVVHIGERLADALSYVHSRGVVHRDLKPSNVLLSPNGEPVLLDFNLALDEDTHEYRLGGTLPYMPPEQLQALERRPGVRDSAGDIRTDLYGLGVILYELLTGQHPFGPVPAKLSTREIRSFLIEKHSEGPRPVRSLNPAVDSKLARLIERCLATDPKQRPSTASEIRSVLRQLHSPAHRAVRWAADHRKILAAAAVAGIMLAGGTTAYVATLPPAAQRHARAGDDYAKSGKWTDAIAAYTKSLEDDPNQKEVYFARGRALMQRPTRPNLESALTDFRESDREEVDGRTLACRAFCQAALGNVETAMEFGEMAIRAGYSNPAVLSNLAYSQWAFGWHREAVETASRALTIDPDHPGALVNRALARFALSEQGESTQTPLAYEDVRRGLAHSVGSAETYKIAASLGEKLLRNRGKAGDAELEKQVNEFLIQAIQRGALRVELENCPMLGKRARALPAVIVTVPSGNAALGERLIDPLS